MKNYLKKLADKIDKKLLIRNTIILISILFVFILIDQLTKVFIFAKADPNWKVGIESGRFISEGKLFGIRLVINTGMFSSLGADTVPYWGVQTITSLIAIIVILVALFNKNLITVVGFSLIAAGALGNILDRYMLIDDTSNKGHYVRDWIYNPWFDRGTYNIADIEVILGSTIAGLGILIGLFKDIKNNPTNK